MNAEIEYNDPIFPSIFQGDFFESIDYALRKNNPTRNTSPENPDGITKIFVVTGKTTFSKSGAEDVMDDLESIEYLEFNDFTANPKLEDVMKAIDAMNAFKPDIVLAIGGGTAMDIGKLLVGFSGKDKSDIDAYIKSEKTIETIACPLWVVPTTAGSGAESTHFAVLYHNGEKYSIGSEAILPGFVFLDSILTHTAPENVATCAGIDAMCQALESFWANNATNESRNYASLSMKSTLESIIPAMEGERKELRELQYASYLAGKAINISKTTAGHAFSYYLTQHHNVTHGNAVAIMLRYVFIYALKFGDEKTLQLCEEMAENLNIDKADLPQFLEEVMDEFDLPTTLKDLGITDTKEIKKLCESVNVERLGNSPVVIDLGAFQDIIKAEDAKIDEVEEDQDQDQD